jgi:UDP:flavonoid glycosyltransferase YjiC (YdhE family)
MTVLDDPASSNAARRIQASYATAGGAKAAADALQALAQSGGTA